MRLVIENPAIARDLKAEQQAAADKLPPPESPPLPTKFVRFSQEMRGWLAMGARFAPKAERAQRAAACAACTYFAPEGNWSFGECRAPGCGCTGAKRWLATARCPHPAGSRWRPAPTVEV